MSMWGPGTWSSLPWGITRKDSLTYATKECTWRILKTLIASIFDVSGLLFGRSGIKTLLKTVNPSCKSSNSRIPDFTQLFVLHTDASQYEQVAVLCQKWDAQMRFIGYGSRSLSQAERNYHLHSGRRLGPGVDGFSTLQRLLSPCTSLCCLHG